MANAVLAAPETLASTAPIDNKIVTSTAVPGQKNALDVFLRGGEIALSSSVASPDGEERIAPYIAVAVPPNVETDILLLTAPAGLDLYLALVESSLDVIGAEVRVYIDDVERALQRTWWKTFNLSIPFAFDQYGLRIPAGSVVRVTAKHARPFTAQANTRLVGTLKAVA